MEREICNATIANCIKEAVIDFAAEWHLEYPAGYNNSLCKGYTKLKQCQGGGAGLKGWTVAIESDKDRDVFMLIDMAIRAAKEKLKNKHGDSLNSDTVERARRDYANGFEPDPDAFKWAVLQKAEDWKLKRISQVFDPADQTGEPIEAQQQGRKAVSFRHLQECFDNATEEERNKYFLSGSGRHGKQEEYFRGVLDDIEKVYGGTIEMNTFIRYDVRDFKKDLKKRIADKENG